MERLDRQINSFALSSIKTAIFDMDGTIYQLDGDKGGFKNSSLHKKTRENTTKFISQRENISLEDAEKILEQLDTNNVFHSIYAAEKYHITRKDFFDIVWNIDPKSIVTNYEEAVQTITALADVNIELILLTQSPQVWQNNVFLFLGLQNLFTNIYTGESYINKTEMYSKIAETHVPKTVLAIGDQLETDIIPAKDNGFYTFHISSPKDLLKLLNHE